MVIIIITMMMMIIIIIIIIIMILTVITLFYGWPETPIKVRQRQRHRFINKNSKV